MDKPSFSKEFRKVEEKVQVAAEVLVVVVDWLEQWKLWKCEGSISKCE